MEAIQEGERLWRDVYREEQKQAARAKRSNYSARSIFGPQVPNAEISTNLYDRVCLQYATEKGDDRAKQIKGSRGVEGWLVISVRDASREHRRIVQSPQPDNPYHADIILPDEHAHDWEDDRVRVLEFLSLSRWQDRAGPFPEFAGTPMPRT